jgi:hypothetical protein
MLIVESQYYTNAPKEKIISGLYRQETLNTIIEKPAAAAPIAQLKKG